MKKIITFIAVIVLICLSAFGQDEPMGLPVFDSYESLKEAHPSPQDRIPLEVEFFKGSVVIQFQDSSVITPEGVMIKISRVYPGDKAKLVNKAITDVKGMFYLKSMTTGDYKVEAAFKGNHVLTKYFSISEPNGVLLQRLVIPVENIERREIQQQQFHKF